MNNFYVGQKVICVDAINNCVEDFPLIHNAIYTVRGFYNNSYGYPTLLLEEIGARNSGCIDDGYKAIRFRPLIEKKTDISIFTEMLNVAPIKQKEKIE